MTVTGFVDLQVNGYGGVDFNGDDLNAESLHRACQLMQSHGVAGFLATVITDQIPVMCRRIRRIVELREQDAVARQLIRGLHIEGPFISSRRGYLGAHPVDPVQPGNLDAARLLIDAGGGLVRIMTLAPECDPEFSVTRALSCDGIAISAGHTDADMPTLLAALDAGLTMFTHLGNACPPELPRHDNIIQRALSLAGRLRLGFIADGVHIPAFALKNYLKAAGVENCFVVSDAMSAAGLGPGVYRLGRNEVAVGDDCAARSPDGSHLVGSAITMRRAFDNLIGIGFSAAECQALLVENPSRMIGTAHE